MDKVDALQKQKQFAYLRMLWGAFLGGLITYSSCYLWAWSNDNLNPITGLGILLLTAAGIVVGVLLSLLSRKWQNH